MDKLETAKTLLTQIGMPAKQQSMICVFTLLAMANVRKDTPWSEATNEWIPIHDIIAFTSDCYDVVYAENSRETFRKQALILFAPQLSLKTMDWLQIVRTIAIV